MIPSPSPYELVVLDHVGCDLDHIAALCMLRHRIRMAGGAEGYELTREELWVGFIIWLIKTGRLTP